MARPKPTKLKLLEGNRGKRKLDLNGEPQPALGAPRMPSGMPAAAQGIWKQLVPELDRLGLLTVVDGTALEAACRGAAQGQMADREIQRLQSLIDSEKADQMAYYKLSIVNAVSKKGWQQWKTFAIEFGLTPASRSRLSIADSPGSQGHMDPIERALCGDD